MALSCSSAYERDGRGALTRRPGGFVAGPACARAWIEGSGQLETRATPSTLTLLQIPPAGDSDGMSIGLAASIRPGRKLSHL